jgi:putative transposase
VEREKANHSVAMLCRVLRVSPSGYWAWRKRPPSRRELADQELFVRVANVFHQSRRTYGAPRVHAELVDQGIRCSCKRVARLMKAGALVGCHRRRRTTVTTQRDRRDPAAPDLVRRCFVAKAPNRLWVADITYVHTWSGFLYLAVVMDAFSRRVIGWHMADHLRTELVRNALDMAIWNRRPEEGVVHHSDRGSQYTSLDFGRRCWEAGIVASMGSVGDCFDNALCESFFATLECELLDRRTFRNRNEAKLHIFDFIEAFYNPWRRHSSLGNVSPINYERRYLEQEAA